MKNICLLGSTGSIGKNTLDVIRQHHEKFNALTLTTNKNISLLSEQISEFNPKHVVIYDKHAHDIFCQTVNHAGFKVWQGNEGLLRSWDDDEPDIVVNAFVGFAGLEPTIEAIKRKITVALANKETLVVAGSYIMDLIGKYGVDLVPIDSEHSAIWQCLAGESGNNIKRLFLTASGGPFRRTPASKLAEVTPEQALKHPNWDMGSKITIDSATLMNKGLEVIEAFWLYKVPLKSIEVVIHPQSIIHSMVEFEDKSIKAQLGVPDMRIPIQYAISYPDRYPLNIPEMDFLAANTLTFEQPDMEKFPCLGLAYEVLRRGESYPAVLNAANEVAVAAFLEKKLKFTDISHVIEDQLHQHSSVDEETFESYLEIDLQTRRITSEYIGRINKKK